MDEKPPVKKDVKHLKNKCIAAPNAQIYNRTTSSKGDWSVNKWIVIFSEGNSVTIRQADYAEIATKVEADGEVGFRIQDHRQSNPAFNTTATPAIVVKFVHDEEHASVSLDVMESLPGTEFDKDDVNTRYRLVLDSEMFFTYGYVVENDIKVAEEMATKKHGKKTIDLT